MAKKKKTKGKKKAKKAVVSDEPLTKAERLEQLHAIAAQCNKALGKQGAVYLGSEQREFERTSSGILALDYVLGGGLVKGQMVQFTGADSSFKTSAAMIAAANTQYEDGTVLWVAGEGFDKSWAEAWGVDLEELHVVTADTGDTAMETAVTMVQAGLIDLMVLDSLQSLGTTREMESGVDDEAYAGAGAPQMWGRVMRKMYAAMNAGADTATIAVSQVRAPIGKFGSTEPEGSGIFSIKHWKAADIFFRKGEFDYDGKADETRRTNARQFKLRCMKNKTAVSERQASFELRYEDAGPMVDNLGTLYRLAKSYDLLEQRGAWFHGYGMSAQGEDKFIEAMADNAEAVDQMTEDVMEATE